MRRNGITAQRSVFTAFSELTKAFLVPNSSSFIFLEGYTLARARGENLRYLYWYELRRQEKLGGLKRLYNPMGWFDFYAPISKFGRGEGRGDEDGRLWVRLKALHMLLQSMSE
jgi:hypothetical protein